MSVECLVLNGTSLLTPLPSYPSKAQGTLWRRGQKEYKISRMKGNAVEILSSEYTMVVALMKSLQMSLPARHAQGQSSTNWTQWVINNGEDMKVERGYVGCCLREMEVGGELRVEMNKIDCIQV